MCDVCESAGARKVRRRGKVRAHGMREARGCARAMREGAGMKHSMVNRKGDSGMGGMRAYGVKRGKVRACNARESACQHLYLLINEAQEARTREAHEAYGRGNIARICARSKCVISSLDGIIMRENENEGTLDETQGRVGMSEAGALGGACNWQDEFLHNALQVEGAPMGGAARGVGAPYKLIGCARCARLGAISREFDYIGRTREERPFSCKCAQMLRKWAVRVVYQGAVGA
ncbi:hypothetical protein C8R48DRAFT_674979 [Suillus tomentosus]|nr:hypothetical protein C8R48DRAFT_674979 [Suillus tomentosus]